MNYKYLIEALTTWSHELKATTIIFFCLVLSISALLNPEDRGLCWGHDSLIEFFVYPPGFFQNVTPLGL